MITVKIYMQDELMEYCVLKYRITVQLLSEDLRKKPNSSFHRF